jgi:probable phosphoglycerate mutase
MAQPGLDHADLVLLRHGHAHPQEAGDRYRTDHAAPLTDLGRTQAHYAAEQLAQFKICRIVASDMDRAAETAAIVGRRLDLEPTFHRELREVDCGLTSGCTEEELRQRFPHHTGLVEVGYMGQFPTGTNHVPADLAYPGGESIADVAARAIPFFAALCAEESGRGEPTLIVAHAWVLTTLLCHVVEAPIASYFRFYLQNTAISRVRADRQGRGVVHGLNMWPWESADGVKDAFATRNGTGQVIARRGPWPGPADARTGSEGGAPCA